jgi:cytoskeletal protein RodZ
MDTQGKTIGEMLRTAREARSLTIEQVHRDTRISVQAIRALEQDDFGAFPSETYLKGFLRTYGDFLGLDGARLWSMTGQRSGGSTGGGPSWEIEEGLRVEKLGPPAVVRRLILPALVVLLVVLVILLVRERRKSSAHADGTTPVEATRIAG